MLKSSFFIVCTILIQSNVLAQRFGTPIEVIASKFYNTYDVSQQNIYINFEKRGWQWKVTATKYNGNDPVVIGTYLFFDVDSGGFQNLPFELKTKPEWVHVSEYLNDSQIRDFNIHNYFGYPGWYIDVIKSLADKDHLSDSSLYSLGRAYSNYASCLLSVLTVDALQNEIFNLPMTRNCMTPGQREKYDSIESKAIECFYKLYNQNINFETVVGNIRIKYANEVMVKFLTCLTYSDRLAGSYQLPDHLFPDSIITKTEHILKSCPKDAILLSYGDNDFYPVLYVQQKLRVRRDVHLINQRTIFADRNIYMATQPQFDSKPVRLSVNYEQYKGKKNDYVLLKDSTKEMNFEDVIDSIKSGHLNKDGVLTLTSKEFIIRRTSGKTRTVNDDTLHFKASARYLLKNDWIILDMINNLDGRKLCSQTVLYEELSPLNRYFSRIDDNLFIY